MTGDETDRKRSDLEVSAPEGARVYGDARNEQGERYGVYGETDGDGYGLYTPDDGRVDGRLEATAASVRNLENEIRVTNFPGGDLGAQFNNAVDKHGLSNVRYVVPPGEYTITTPVVLDGSRYSDYQRNVGVFMRGARTTLATDRPAVEINDVGNLFVDVGQMRAAPSGPAVGLLLFDGGDGGGGDGGNAGGPEGKRVRGKIAGAFDTATVYVHGRENVVLHDLRLRNSGDGHVLAVSGNNVRGVEPSGADFSGDPSSPQSLVVCGGCKLFSVEPSSRSVVYLEGKTSNLTVRDTEVATAGPADSDATAAHFRLDLRNETPTSLSFKDLRVRMWGPSAANSAVGWLLSDTNRRGTELSSLTIRDVYFTNAVSDSGPTEPMVRVVDDVDVDDLDLGGRLTAICANPAVDVGTTVDGTTNNLTRSRVKLTNKQLAVDGNLRNTRVHGQFDPDGFGLDVSGTLDNVRYWEQPLKVDDGGTVHLYGCSVRSDAGVRPASFADLESVSGTDGELRNHDGTGAPPRGLAQWDATLASGAGNWRSLVDGTTFGPNTSG